MEDLVNEAILDAVDVQISEEDIDKAKEMGAMALFGEKYGKIVRVVNVPGHSIELCGGVHVSNTSRIGLFKILGESSVGAGLRRIEAVTGHGALLYTRELEALLEDASQKVKGRPNTLLSRIEALQDELKAEKHHAAELEQKLVAAAAQSAGDKVKDVKGIPVLIDEVKVDDVSALRSMGDQLRDKTGGIVVLFAAMAPQKVNILTMASKEAVAKGAHAGKIVKAAAQVLGGNGGGRPDMAQAGGKNSGKIAEAMAETLKVIENMIQ